VSGGLIKMRVPLRLADGSEVEFQMAVTEQDARTLVDAPRRAIRGADAGLVQALRDGLTKFFEVEDSDAQQ
jgi:hypothetical protein